MLIPLALAGSLGTHVVLAGLSPERTATEPGGDVAGEVALGSAFADLVVGVMESTRADGDVKPAPVDATEEPDPEATPDAAPEETREADPDETPPEAPDRAREAEPDKAVAETPGRTASKTPERAEAQQTPQAPAAATAALEAVPLDAPQSAAVPPLAAEAAQSLESVGAQVADVPVLNTVEAAEKSAPTVTAPATTQAEAAPSEPEAALAPVEARETIEVTESLRPVPRPPARQAPAPQRQAETPRREPSPAAPARRGNTEVNAARGQSTGSAGAQQSQSNQAQQTTARRAGQAAIDSYNNSILQRVTRAARRLNSRGNRGTVRVTLQISGSGALAGASVSRSSGNANADALALRAARRAGPFGPTPTGGTITRSVTVKVGG
ncbi:MAG: TonB family protein [Pseudomonadota bacterium]